MAGRVKAWCVCWVPLAALWLLLVSKMDAADVTTAALAAVVVAGAAVSVFSLRIAELQPRLGWLGLLLRRVPGQALSDCATVAGALWRRLIRREMVSGEFREVPFDPGGEDPVSAARRALVTAGMSVSPNTIVVSVDDDRGVLIVHQLVPTPETPGRGDRKWPL